MSDPRPPQVNRLDRMLGAVNSRPQRSAVYLLVLLAVVVGAVSLGWGALGRSAGASEVFLEPAGVAGADPFVVLLRTPATVLRLDPGTPGEGVTTVVGERLGLYGGSLEEAVCDKDAMISFLEDNPAEAAAWAQVQGIAVADIRRYVSGLTGVQLRLDTRVTNHGFSDGQATPRQAVLEAGTAVLVDDRGVPRARCYCGNPLLPPVASEQVDYVGTPWEGFDEARLYRVAAGAPQSAFELFDSATGFSFLRPAGTDGERDEPLAEVQGSTSTSVPVVRGLVAAEAVRALEARRFEVTVTEQASDTVPKGQAIGTSPPTGSPLPAGATVTLFVSSGPATGTTAATGSTATTASTGSTGATGTTAGGTTGSTGTTRTTAGTGTTGTGGTTTSTRPGGTTSTVPPGPDGVLVPGVVGLDRAQAATRLQQAGLVVSVATEASPDVPAGTVLSQSPATGARVAAGSMVALVVSSGRPPVSVPNVVGQRQPEAEKALGGVGLVPRVVPSPTSEFAAGTVFAQDPAVGAAVPVGTTVTITVATVPPPVIDSFGLESTGACTRGSMVVVADWAATGAGSVEIVDLTTSAVVATGGATGRATFVYSCFDSAQQFVASRTYRLVARASADANLTATRDVTVRASNG